MVGALIAAVFASTTGVSISLVEEGCVGFPLEESTELRCVVNSTTGVVIFVAEERCGAVAWVASVVVAGGGLKSK